MGPRCDCNHTCSDCTLGLWQVMEAPPSSAFLLELQTFAELLAESRKLELFPLIQDSMEKSVKAFIEEKLKDCSDVRYDPDVAKAIIRKEDFGDLVYRQTDKGFLVVRHIRSLIQAYILELQRSRGVRVPDPTKFGDALDSLGIRYTPSRMLSLSPEALLVTLALVGLIWLAAARK